MIESTKKTMRIETTQEYLDVFNSIKAGQRDKIKNVFVKSGTNETFKYIIREYTKHNYLEEYEKLPVNVENNIEKEKNDEIILKLRLEIVQLLYKLTEKYQMSNNELVAESLKMFDWIKENRKKKEMEKQNNANKEE